MTPVRQMTTADLEAAYRQLRAFDRAAVKAIVNGEAVIISASGHVDDLARLERDDD